MAVWHQPNAMNLPSASAGLLFWVLAGFNPEWPVLDLAVAGTSFSEHSLPTVVLYGIRQRGGARLMIREDEFRRNADECRQQAERAINPLDKERWLKIAEHWLKMAQEAESDRP